MYVRFGKKKIDLRQQKEKGASFSFARRKTIGERRAFLSERTACQVSWGQRERSLMLRTEKGRGTLEALWKKKKKKKGNGTLRKETKGSLNPLPGMGERTGSRGKNWPP